MLSIFYTRKEIATRISILYTGNILATAFAGLIAIGIFKLDGAAGQAGWQWLFIIQGIATFVVAVAAYFVLPDDPLNTKWLTPEERLLANNRILLDTVGEQGIVSPFAGLKAAASDPKLWLFAFMQHMHLAANGFKVCLAPLQADSRTRFRWDSILARGLSPLKFCFISIDVW
jgi:MFS family permease